MNIVVPMAGRGRRFSEAGFSKPKPLIEVHGRPMYSLAVDPLPLELATCLVFVCLEEHLVEHGLEDDIRTRYAPFDPVVVALDAVTDGQAATVLSIAEHLESDQPLLIHNADTVCLADLAGVLPGLAEEVAGLIVVFAPEGDHWSFARVDDRGRVVETAEKRRISRWATTGLYHFSRAETFVRHATDMIDARETVSGEYYVAPVYNRLVSSGAEVRIHEARSVWALGTPRELADFEAVAPEGAFVR